VALKEFIYVSGIDEDPSHTNYQNWVEESTLARHMSRLNHAHIIEALASISIGSRRYLMYQWADGGSLRDYWHARSKSELSAELVEEVIDQLWGLADALVKLHEMNCRHGDLKPGNILRIQSGPNLGKLMLPPLQLANSISL